MKMVIRLPLLPLKTMLRSSTALDLSPPSSKSSEMSASSPIIRSTFQVSSNSWGRLCKHAAKKIANTNLYWPFWCLRPCWTATTSTSVTFQVNILSSGNIFSSTSRARARLRIFSIQLCSSRWLNSLLKTMLAWSLIIWSTSWAFWLLSVCTLPVAMISKTSSWNRF